MNEQTTIVWDDNSGNMVPHYGCPKKGDVLIMPKDKAQSYVDAKMAHYRKPSTTKEA